MGPQQRPRPEKIHKDRVLQEQYTGQLFIIDREGSPCQGDCDEGPADDAKYEQVSARHFCLRLYQGATPELTGSGLLQALTGWAAQTGGTPPYFLADSSKCLVVPSVTLEG